MPMIAPKQITVTQMEPLRIKDNSKVGKDETDKIPNLTGRIEDRTLKDLEKEGVFVFPGAIKDAEDITGEQMVLQSRDGSYWSSNVMGFLGYGDERLTIESRFSGDGEDHFLPYLLGKALGLPNILDLMTEASVDSNPLNFLALLFPYYLKKALRKGVYREYTRNLYNDANVKGPIDVARHIRLNTPFTGKVAYSQRELSCDNGLTELVRHTAEFIRGKPYGNRILATARDEVRIITEATPGYKPSDRQRVIGQNGKNPVRHAYFREYLALQRLCLQILRDQRHRIGDGGNRIYGVLFDGAWLWEEYVNSLIGDCFHHPMNKSHKGKQYLFQGPNRKEGEIYPDFISKRDDPRVIADAKYKPVKKTNYKKSTAKEAV